MSLPEMTLSTKTASSKDSGKRARTMSYYAAFIALGLTTASLGPTLPGLAEHTQTRLAEISFLFTARALGYLLGAFLGGYLYDRLPGHPVLAAMLFIMSLTMGLAPLMSWLWLLTVVLLLLGLAESALDVGGNALLVWIHGQKVGPFMNGLHFFFGVGAFLSPVIIAQAVLISGGITWAYWVLAFLIWPVAVWLLRLPSPEIQTGARDHKQTGRVPYTLVALIVLFFFFYMGAEASFGGWIFTYAVALNIATEPVAAYLTSTFWGALTGGRLLAIPLAARFRPRSILLVDLIGCLASLGLILLWPDLLPAVWVGTFGLGLAMASIFPAIISLAERYMPVTGQVTGWFFVGAGVGGMFLPWLIGQLFESVGPQAMMLAMMGNLVLAMVVFAGLIIHSNQLSLKEAEGQTEKA